MTEKIQSKLSKLYRWCESNLLPLNITKCNFVSVTCKFTIFITITISTMIVWKHTLAIKVWVLNLLVNLTFVEYL